MDDIYFSFTLHLHQPIGNFQEIIERAYQKCYMPIIELLLKHPKIKTNIHISGCLFDYIEKHHLDFINKLKELTLRGQVELIGGAFYEPILISIPNQDIVGQIELMSAYLEKKFQSRPQGMWIPERVWKPDLIKPISRTDIKYCILDDLHLVKSGIDANNLKGYFITKENNKKLAVFPSDKTLRYNIPFKDHYEILNYFKTIQNSNKNDNNLFIYADDAEKFGEWPGTYEWVFKKGWLETFFNILTENSSWIKMIKISEYLNNFKDKGEVKIPEASYMEMMHWSNGSWLNFLKKYHESNHMNKKMRYISNKVKKAENKTKDKEKIKNMRKNLYKGQCNCAYWHGVFGGLYLYHLRRATYKHLIHADTIADNILNSKNIISWTNIEYINLNKSKKKEIVFENPFFSLYLDCKKGGIIKEIDYKPIFLNITNTLSRYKEIYHEDILQKIKEKDEKHIDNEIHTIHEDTKKVNPLIDSNITYDKYPKHNLRTYLFNKNINQKDFINSNFDELGTFSNGDYLSEIRKNKVYLEFTDKIQKNKIKLEKIIQITHDNKIKIDINLISDKILDTEILLGVEFNFTMLYLNSKRYAYFDNTKEKISDLDSLGNLNKTKSFGIKDWEENFSLNLKFIKETKKIWFFPIKTVSQSEREYELNYQGTCILPIWQVNLKDRKSENITIELSI